jgi:hypothetical protein
MARLETIFSAVTLVLLNAMVLALAFDPIAGDTTAVQAAQVEAQSATSAA